jgi:hypothetical protein
MTVHRELEEILQHFGTKGMKWGVHKKKDELNSRDRVIKKGTEIQNISSGDLTNKKRHMYASYTSFDKESYVTVMNFMYNGKVQKNEFTVKKDIKIPSDKKLVEEFTALAKKNPQAVSEDMANAYNYVHRFSKKSAKHFEKKLSKIDDKHTKRGEKATKEFIKLMVSDDAARTRGAFFGSLMKQGYDGMSDVNDRDGGAQDPLIIFNTSKNLKTNKSVKLTPEELQKYYEKAMFDTNFQKEGKNIKEVQHKQEVNSMKPELQDILQHHGVKGMHWGKSKAGAESGGGTNPIKARVDSLKREHSLKRTAKKSDNMSTKDIQKLASRAQLENDMKRLSKERHVGSRKDKKDYLKRAEMDDQELSRKVQRLRAKSNLKRVASDATKSQRDIGKKVMHIAAPLALQYALTGSIGKKDIIGAAVNAAVNLGGEKARLAKNLVDQGKQVKKVKHGIEDEETLQHHGVKGMHWGIHKKVKQMVKNHRAKQNKRVLEAHDKLHKRNKTYKKLYEQNSKRYKTHLTAARKAQVQLKAIQRSKVQMAVGAGLMLAPHLAPHVGKAAKVVGKAASNPDNIRKAKNVAQALKRSPIRYVNGAAMKNVVN